jgi:hypothetical protein
MKIDITVKRVADVCDLPNRIACDVSDVYEIPVSVPDPDGEALVIRGRPVFDLRPVRIFNVDGRARVLASAIETKLCGGPKGGIGDSAQLLASRTLNFSIRFRSNGSRQRRNSKKLTESCLVSSASSTSGRARARLPGF